MAKILYLQPDSGASGDMFSAALISLMKNEKEHLKKLNLLKIDEGFSVACKVVQKGGISAVKFCVTEPSASSHHKHGRTFQEIKTIIENFDKIDNASKTLAVKIFHKLAEAEAKIHGTTTNLVHFHEVGAVDAIVDIVSAAILVTELKPDKIISSPLNLGSGSIKSAHGVLPVPAPATAEIIKNIPSRFSEINGELTTPTGAAILAVIVDEWTTSLTGKIKTIGYGAGSKDFKEIPNVLRAMLIESDLEEKDEIAVIECNIDDMPPEHLTIITQNIINEGALDYTIIPAVMKKNRSGFIIQVLAKRERLNSISKLLLTQTTTIGIRYRFEKRIVLKREIKNIDTPFGQIKAKFTYDENGKLLRIKPEQDSIMLLTSNENYLQIHTKISAYLTNLIPTDS